MTVTPGRMVSVYLWFCLTLGGASTVHAERDWSRKEVYRTAGEEPLHAWILLPEGEQAKPSTAILFFHGGGWKSGGPEQTLWMARAFSAPDVICIGIQYRLIDDKRTPADCVEDALAAFAWVRANAQRLNIDPNKIVGHGVSAGGHLVAAAGTLPRFRGRTIDSSERPNAMLLWSPALGVSFDPWFVKSMRDLDAKEYCPLQQVNGTCPPAYIVQGAEDSMTPLKAAEPFVQFAKEGGVNVQMHVFRGVGHLLTRDLTNQEDRFDPDPEMQREGLNRQKTFLVETGFATAP